MTEEINEEMDEKMNEDNEELEEDELIESPFKRVLMVLFSPRLVYESLSVKKRSKLDWIIPIALSVLFALIIINAGYDYIRKDQYEAAIKRIENNANLTEEQRDAGIEQMEQFMEGMAGFQRIFGNVSAVIMSFVWVLVMAVVMMAITRFILQGKLSFGDAFKIGALGAMTTIVGSVVKVPLIFYHESITKAKLSLGLLFPESMEEEFVVRLFDIDIFILWYVIIICIGMSVFSKKSLMKALVPMVILWFIFRFAVTSITGAFSGFGM